MILKLLMLRMTSGLLSRSLATAGGALILGLGERNVLLLQYAGTTWPRRGLRLGQTSVSSTPGVAFRV